MEPGSTIKLLKWKTRASNQILDGKVIRQATLAEFKPFTKIYYYSVVIIPFLFVNPLLLWTVSYLIISVLHPFTMDLVFPNCINAPSFPAERHRISLRRTRSQISHSTVQTRNRWLPIRVSSLAAVASTPENSPSGTATSGTRISRRVASTSENENKASSELLRKSSAAMEQLDIERGVCLPFRKYSPETVWITVYKLFDICFDFWDLTACLLWMNLRLCLDRIGVYLKWLRIWSCVTCEQLKIF